MFSAINSTTILLYSFKNSNWFRYDHKGDVPKFGTYNLLCDGLQQWIQDGAFVENASLICGGAMLLLIGLLNLIRPKSIYITCMLLNDGSKMGHLGQMPPLQEIAYKIEIL